MSALIRNVALNADMLALLAADERVRSLETLMFLPNQRACSRLKALLLEQHPAAFLPTLMPLGQLDELWLLQHAMQAHHSEALLAIPPAIHDYEAIMRLTQVMAQEKWLSGDYQLEQIWAAASAIWEVFEALESEAKPISSLEVLGVGNVSKHWRDRVLTLRKAGKWWSEFSQRSGVVRATQRRNELAQWLANDWQRSIPNSPIIIAGSTGSQASTLALMQSALTLPQGEVWLHGIDVDLVQSDAPLANSHAQMLFRRLLEKLPSATPIETLGEENEASSALLHGFRSICPAPPPDTIQRINAQDEQHEAELAALLAMEALQQDGTSIAIIVQQPKQLRRLQAALEAQGLSADSAVAQSPDCLDFVRVLHCLLQAIGNESNAPAWLALLKQLGWHEAAQQFERKCLRVRASSSSKPILSRMVQWAQPLQLAAISALQIALQPLMQTPHHKKLGSEWLEQLLSAMQQLGVIAQSDNETKIEADLRLAMRAFSDPLIFADMAALCRALLARMGVVLAGNPQARIKIYSPIEARLMHADCWIICGLNEQQWPAPQSSHPWLHPYLAQQLELSSAALPVALAAHDFLALSAASNHVFWLRSNRVDGVDQMPSRWLERFAQTQAKPYAAWLDVQQLSAPCPAVASPPAAYAPIAARPTSMSISALTLLLKNPYGYYAKTILKLQRLEALDLQPDAAYRGDIMHRLMQHVTEQLNSGAPLVPETYLEQLDALLRHESEPIVLYQWAPRLRAMAEEIMSLEQERRASSPQILAEQTYEMPLEGVQINGRADRVEIHGQSAAVIDYKSGSHPTQSELESGYEPQLALLAAMQPAPLCQEMAYWKISGVNGAIKPSPYKGDVADLVAFYLGGLGTLLQYYQREEARYIAVEGAGRYNDYALLARQEIWSSS